MIISFDTDVYESSSSFVTELFEVIKEDYDIQDSFIRLEHTYNKTNNMEILTEGFSDIVENIVKFFKNLLAKFKEFFKKVMMYMNSHLMELGKFVNKYKEQLLKIDTSFTMRGYKFTIPDKSCPNLEPYQTMVSNYNSAISDIKSLNKDELDKERNEFLSDTSLDKLRATILNHSTPIQEEDFVKTIRSSFRDDKDDEEDLEITKSTIGAIVREADSLTKQKSEALKLQADIESLLNKTITFFDKKIAVMYKGDAKVVYGKTINTTDNKFSTSELDAQNHSDGAEKNVNKLLKLKYDQSKQIATMTTTIATERTKAINDNIAFFRKILRDALFKPQETQKKEDN